MHNGLQKNPKLRGASFSSNSTPILLDNTLLRCSFNGKEEQLASLLNFQEK